MVINTYQELMQKLYSSRMAYLKEGNQEKANEIDRIQSQLNSNFEKFQKNPQVICNPQVLSGLHLAIENFVWGYRTENEHLALAVRDDGSIVIDIDGLAFTATDDNRKCKEFKRVIYEKLANSPKYISITQMQCSAKDGTGMEATVPSNASVKSEYDIDYHKSIYTAQGLQVQYCETKLDTQKNKMYGIDGLSDGLMYAIMQQNQPEYNTLFGYSPKINTYGIKKMECNTRGTYFGDEQNIGMCQLTYATPRENNFNYDRETYIQPINFAATGAFLPAGLDSSGIHIPPNTREAENIKAKAIQDFGGKQGWSNLLVAEDYREIPKALHNYAIDKSKECEKFGRVSFASIAEEQRAGSIKAQTNTINSLLTDRTNSQGIHTEPRN